MQLNPDWIGSATSENFEATFAIPFKGPGLYLTTTDTLVVTPNPPDTYPTKNNVWHVEQPKGTIWRVHVYNCRFDQTLLGAIAGAPTRHDKQATIL